MLTLRLQGEAWAAVLHLWKLLFSCLFCPLHKPSCPQDPALSHLRLSAPKVSLHYGKPISAQVCHQEPSDTKTGPPVPGGQQLVARAWLMTACFSSFHLGSEGQQQKLPYAVQEEICLLPDQEEVCGESDCASPGPFLYQLLMP